MTEDEFSYDKGFREGPAVIAEAWFGTSDNYNQGKSLLLFLKKQDGVDEWTDQYPVGDGWGSFDGGETAEHPKKGRLHANSAVAQLAQRAFSAGAETIMRERSQGLGARRANIWNGLNFDWETVEETFKMKDRDEGSDTFGQMVERTTARSFPKTFLGLAGQMTMSEPKAEVEADVWEGVSATTRAAMSQLAREHEYRVWVDKCLDGLQEVRTSPSLLNALGDEGFYNKLKE